MMRLLIPEATARHCVGSVWRVRAATEQMIRRSDGSDARWKWYQYLICNLQHVKILCGRDVPRAETCRAVCNTQAPARQSLRRAHAQRQWPTSHVRLTTTLPAIYDSAARDPTQPQLLSYALYICVNASACVSSRLVKIELPLTPLKQTIHT